MALFGIIASQLHFSSGHSFYASRHKSPYYKRWDVIHKKTPVPCRLLPYLYATPILLFNLLHFKVTKIATCCTAACVSLWKKSPQSELDMQRETVTSRQKQTEKTQTTVSMLVKIMLFNVVAINLFYHTVVFQNFIRINNFSTLREIIKKWCPLGGITIIVFNLL